MGPPTRTTATSAPPASNNARSARTNPLDIPPCLPVEPLPYSPGAAGGVHGDPKVF